MSVLLQAHIQQFKRTCCWFRANPIKVPYVQQTIIDAWSVIIAIVMYNLRDAIAIAAYTKVRLRPHTASITNNTVQFEHA